MDYYGRGCGPTARHHGLSRNKFSSWIWTTLTFRSSCTFIQSWLRRIVHPSSPCPRYRTSGCCDCLDQVLGNFVTVTRTLPPQNSQERC